MHYISLLCSYTPAVLVDPTVTGRKAGDVTTSSNPAPRNSQNWNAVLCCVWCVFPSVERAEPTCTAQCDVLIRDDRTLRLSLKNKQTIIIQKALVQPDFLQVCWLHGDAFKSSSGGFVIRFTFLGAVKGAALRFALRAKVICDFWVSDATRRSENHVTLILKPRKTDVRGKKTT